jgi:hypothetical protein
MITEENILNVLKHLRLTVSATNKEKIIAAYNNVTSIFTPALIDEKIEECLSELEKQSKTRKSILGRNQNRLQQASSLKWDTKSGSATDDVDKILLDLRRELYDLLQLSLYGIIIHFSDPGIIKEIDIKKS